MNSLSQRDRRSTFIVLLLTKEEGQFDLSESSGTFPVRLTAMANNTTTSNFSQSVISAVVDASPYEVGPGDAVWILTSAFIIFTMISGFGLVESGNSFYYEFQTS